MDKGEYRRSTGISFGPLLFLIYINDLPNGLQSNPKLFAGDTFFSTVQDITTSTVSLNNDLTKISQWAVQWKMNLNPDPTKQAQELLFSRKTSSKPYPSLNFNNNTVHQVQLQKHLGLFLDPKLSFDEHIQCILIKTRKTIGLIRKLQPIIPKAALLTIYKSFFRPQLDYGGVICDALLDLVPFLQFKKWEKHRWGSANFSKVAGFFFPVFGLNTPPWVFSRFLNCTNGTKSSNISHLSSRI